MSANKETQRLSIIWQTLAAFLLSFVTFIGVSFIINALVVLMGFISVNTQDDKNLIIDLGRATTPNIIGVSAARVICDKLLPVYSKRAVLAFFILLSIPVFFVALRENQTLWPRIFGLVAGFFVVISAFYFFWKNENNNA